MIAQIEALSPGVRDKVRAVQELVAKRISVTIPEEQILEMHMRCLEPKILARAICFAITQDPIDSSDEDLDEPPSHVV